MPKSVPIEATAEINRLLLRTAIKADPIVERSVAQKEIRIAKMRAELVELGYSIVSSEWLRRVHDHLTPEDLKRIDHAAPRNTAC